MDPTQCAICLDAVEEAQPIGSPSTAIASAYRCDNPLCRTVYCRPCLYQWLRNAAHDSTLHPVRCCDAHELISATTLQLLNREEVLSFYTQCPVHCFLSADRQREALLLRCAERKSASPLYCPRETCAVFLPEAKDATDTADTAKASSVCPRCHVRVCRQCHGRADDAAHTADPPGTPCHRTHVHQTEGILASLQASGCQLCPRCKTAVERLPGGCSEVECLACGAAFCIACLEDVEGCQCRDGLRKSRRTTATVVAEMQREMPSTISEAVLGSGVAKLGNVRRPPFTQIVWQVPLQLAAVNGPACPEPWTAQSCVSVLCFRPVAARAEDA